MTTLRLPSAMLAVGTVILCACTSAPPQQEGPPPATPAAAVEPAGPGAAKPEVSINAVMVALVDHAGHSLWDAEQEGHAPKTDADWQVIAEHAVQIAAAGPAITVGGTGPSDAIWVQSPSWHAHAQHMSDAGVAAMNAANGHDFKALVAANSQLVESCEQCHKEFKPALPSEGIVHTHAH